MTEFMDKVQSERTEVIIVPFVVECVVNVKYCELVRSLQASCISIEEKSV